MIPSEMQDAFSTSVVIALDPAVHTVGDLKTLLESRTGVAPVEQTLSYGEQLDSDGLALAAYNIPSGGQILLAASSSASGLPTVSVAMPTSLSALYGASINVPLAAGSETVESMVAKVSAFTGQTPPPELALLDATYRLMDGSETLTSSSVTSQFTFARPMTDGSVTLSSLGVPNFGDIDLYVQDDKVSYPRKPYPQPLLPPTLPAPSPRARKRR